ncbi:MAG: DUF2807 domain-containing protein [Bacteroidota bacterium]
MKNVRLLIVLLLTANVAVSFAQKKEKIKGNRNVKFVQTAIENYNTLEIGEDMEVAVVQGQAPMVEVEADENLHEVIQFTASGGRLIVNTSKRITSKKALKIRVYHTGTLTKIIARDDATLSSLGDISLEKLDIEAANSAELYITLRAKEFKLTASERTRTELNLSSENASFILNDDSKIEALINADLCNIDMYQKANARIDGDINQLSLALDNTAYFSGKELTAKNCNLNAEGRSDCYINASDKLVIAASGSTKVYVYNNPEIDLKTFQGNAILYKKE